MQEEAESKYLHFVVDILALISSPVLVCQSSKSRALTIHPVTLVPSSIRPSHQPVTCLHRVDVFAFVSVEKTIANIQKGTRPSQVLQLKIIYRAPLGQVCTPRPFFLSSLYSPSYRAPSAQMYTAQNQIHSILLSSSKCVSSHRRS